MPTRLLLPLLLLSLTSFGLLAASGAGAVTLTPGNIIMIGGGCGESLCYLDTGTGDVVGIAADFEGNELAVESAHSVLILDRFRTQGTGGIVRVDTRTGAVTPIVSDNPAIGDVVVTPSGEIYAQLIDSIVRVDGETGAFTPVWETAIEPLGGLAGIAAGPGGSLITLLTSWDDLLQTTISDVLSVDPVVGDATSIGGINGGGREIAVDADGNVFVFLPVAQLVDGLLVSCCGPNGGQVLQADEEYQHNYFHLTVDLDGNPILAGRTPVDEPTWDEILVFAPTSAPNHGPIASFDMDAPVGALEVVPAWVPEPSTAMLLLLGFAGLGVRGRARR